MTVTIIGVQSSFWLSDCTQVEADSQPAGVAQADQHTLVSSAYIENSASKVSSRFVVWQFSPILNVCHSSFSPSMCCSSRRWKIHRTVLFVCSQMWALWEAAFHWWDGGRHQLSELFIGHVSSGKPSPSFQSGQSLAFLSSFCCINYLDICQNTLPVVSKNYLILRLLYGLRSARSTQARVLCKIARTHLFWWPGCNLQHHLKGAMDIWLFVAMVDWTSSGVL